MSNRYGPRIVTDGLVLCLDAADRNSYPGSGASWIDLTGNNSVPLYNGPSFVSSNGGALNFDGTNDYATMPNLGSYMSSYPGTLSVWFSPDNTTDTNKYLLQGVGGGTNRYYVQYDAGYARVWRGNPAGGGAVGSCEVGGLYNVVNAYNSNTIYGYFNGELTLEESYTNSGGFVLNYIGQQPGGTNYFNGKIFAIQIYNRLLSADEIRQNYNATKGRFGL